MVLAPCDGTTPVPPPAYQRAGARHRSGLHLDVRTIVETLCQLAVRLARPGCTQALPKGPGGAPRVYSDASLLLIALLRTLWQLSLWDMPGTRARVLLVAWPALAAPCGLPADRQGRPRVPSPATMSKRAAAAGAPPYEGLFVEAVRQALRTRLIGARDLIIDSAPITVGRRADPDAGYPRTGVLPPGARQPP